MSAKTPESIIEQIRVLAAQGFSSKGIAEEIGKTDDQVRKIASKNNISLRKYVDLGKPKPKANNQKGHKSFLASLPTDEEVRSRAKDYAESLGVKNPVTVRQATPKELAELADIKPASKQSAWHEKWSDI